jgi:secondary thiamine-phosphate synthase enzyme
MKQARHTLETKTHRPGLYDIKRCVAHFAASSEIMNGVLTCFIRHTSASLVIQENADPDVLNDLENFFRGLVSRDPKNYRHTTEGPDDMASHIRSALTQTSLSIPVTGGKMVLGTWQGIYVFEHRDAPHTRQVALHIIGE